MSDSRLPRLLSLPHGSVDRSEPRWHEVEHSLGLILPGSYKALVELFGASSWGEFLHVLSPFDERLNLERKGERILEADKETRRSFPSHYPLPLYPESGGLLPWAITDNGDTLYFITSGPPDQWPTLIKGPRAPEFEVSFLSPSLLVHHVAAGTYRSIILPRL